MAYYLRTKDQAFEYFAVYFHLCERQIGQKLLTLCSNHGGEYVNSAFTDFCSREGILRQFTVPYSHEQNPVAERKNRTIQQIAKTLLHAARLPQTLWAEAVSTAIYISNRLPTKSFNDGTPYQLWTGRKPSVSHFKIFGYQAYAHIPDKKRR